MPLLLPILWISDSTNRSRSQWQTVQMLFGASSYYLYYFFDKMSSSEKRTGNFTNLHLKNKRKKHLGLVNIMISHFSWISYNVQWLNPDSVPCFLLLSYYHFNWMSRSERRNDTIFVVNVPGWPGCSCVNDKAQIVLQPVFPHTRGGSPRHIPAKQISMGFRALDLRIILVLRRYADPSVQTIGQHVLLVSPTGPEP